jgi:hypothetical protein
MAATRRELLGHGGWRAAALAVGAALAPTAAARAAVQAEDDVSPRALLSRALVVEAVAQFAHPYVERHFSLSRHGRSVLRLLAGQERAHARALERSLRRLGGPLPHPPHTPPRSVQAADEVLDFLDFNGSLAELRDTKHALELLLRIEYAQEGAYYRCVEHLSDPAMALMAAEVLAVEAQHVVLLRELHQPGYLEGAAPDSFVVGPR